MERAPVLAVEYLEVVVGRVKIIVRITRESRYEVNRVGAYVGYGYLDGLARGELGLRRAYLNWGAVFGRGIHGNRQYKEKRK